MNLKKEKRAKVPHTVSLCCAMICISLLQNFHWKILQIVPFAGVFRTAMCFPNWSRIKKINIEFRFFPRVRYFSANCVQLLLIAQRFARLSNQNLKLQLLLHFLCKKIKNKGSEAWSMLCRIDDRHCDAKPVKIRKIYLSVVELSKVRSKVRSELTSLSIGVVLQRHRRDWWRNAQPVDYKWNSGTNNLLRLNWLNLIKPNGRNAQRTKCA